MRVPGIKTLRFYARRLRRRFAGGALILGYHRVADLSMDPFDMCVSPKNFAEQLRILRRCANLLSLDALLEGLRDEHLPERAVALSFDDGYSDVLYHVAPLLNRYRIHATVFVTTGYLGYPFWWDELASLLYSPDLSLEHISKFLNDKTFERIRAKIERKKLAGDTQTRQQLLVAIYKWFLHLPDDQREIGMSQLRKLGGKISGDLSHVRTLTPQELTELASGDFVDIGAHTVKHPVLARLNLEDQLVEIQRSKSYLENLLERPVRGFSYPNGSYTKETLELVRDCGFSYACASHSDIVLQESHHFALPRFWISNWDGATFSHWLDSWLYD